MRTSDNDFIWLKERVERSATKIVENVPLSIILWLTKIFDYGKFFIFDYMEAKKWKLN